MASSDGRHVAQTLNEQRAQRDSSPFVTSTLKPRVCARLLVGHSLNFGHMPLIPRREALQ